MLSRQSFARACPCTAGRCLTASFSGVREAGRQGIRSRHISTAQNPVSIFSSNASPWDAIFEDIKETPGSQLLPRGNPRSLKSASLGRGNTHGPRAVAMTRKESDIFNSMFQQIFSNASSATGTEGGIGQVPGNSPVASQLRMTKRLRWSSEADQELDRKQEEMELCETDLQLLEWAMREVFGESERYTEAAAAARASPSATTKTSSAATGRSDFNLPLQPLSYPHLLAALMRMFREKFRDPHLALAMFEHARNLSITSFVFGCTTPAYNELIETRWRCFRDLRGVVDGLEEMRVNGIALDGRTRLLAETIRREVGERTVWQEESSLGSGEVWDMVARIERLTVEDGPKSKSKREAGAKGKERPRRVGDRASGRKQRKWEDPWNESWKKEALDVDARDNWAFDKWTPKKTSYAQKRPLLL